MKRIRLPWRKIKRHRPNPKKVYWNNVRRRLTRFWRNLALIILFAGALVIILLD